MARTRKAKKNVVKVDFTGVESSGSVREGRQIATVKEAEVKTSENTGNDFISWKLSCKGGTVYHNTSLTPQSLWNLRNFLEAAGMEVPDSALELELDEMIDAELGVDIEHETYQQKKKPVLVDVFPVDELDGDTDDEDEPEDDDEDDSEEEDSGSDDLTIDDLNDMDKDELLELAEEEEIKVLAKVKRSEAKLRAHLIAELGLEEEDEDEEEDEPEEKPTRRSRKSGSKTMKKGSKVTFEDDGEELEGKVVSINQKEGFAVLDVDGEEWEVELDDIKVK